MRTHRHPRRGRPPKAGRRKAEYLDIRLEASEKEAFKDAAGLAGLDLSAWVRERLRVVARKELENADRPVKFLDKTNGRTRGRRGEAIILRIRYVKPANLEVEFADGFQGSMPVTKLEMPIDKIRWSSVTVTNRGTSATFKGIKGDLIPIDASTIRYLVDTQYAAKKDRSLESHQLSRSELAKMAHDNAPPQSWYEDLPEDLTRESWK